MTDWQTQPAALAARQVLYLQLLAKANSDRSKYDLAERAYRDGEIPVAARIYMSLIRSRIQNPITMQAKERLGTLAKEAREKVKEVDAMLSMELIEPSQMEPAELIQWQESVRTAFDKYDEVLENYGNVPGVKREITNHVAKQRRRPECAAVLKEANAKRLWDLGQQQEHESHDCCAYWLYKDAVRLRPAPSALQALARIEAMEQSPELLAAAGVCRDLQVCHKTFKSAEWLQVENPDRARQLFADILERAPADSGVYRAAKERYDALPR